MYDKSPKLLQRISICSLAPALKTALMQLPEVLRLLAVRVWPGRATFTLGNKKMSVIINSSEQGRYPGRWIMSAANQSPI